MKEKNQVDHLLAFCANKIFFQKNNQVFLKELYEIYKRDCLIEYVQPVEVSVFLDMVKKHVEQFHVIPSVKYIEKTENSYFLHLRVVPNPVLEVCKLRIEQLQRKAQSENLTAQEKNDLEVLFSMREFFFKL